MRQDLNTINIRTATIHLESKMNAAKLPPFASAPLPAAHVQPAHEQPALFGRRGMVPTEVLLPAGKSSLAATDPPLVRIPFVPSINRPILATVSPSRQISIRGSVVLFDHDCLLPPPHRNYAKDPELLAADWEHLHVFLHPGQQEDIGVKFWKQLYKGSKHWPRLRKQFSEWAVRSFSVLLYQRRPRHLTLF